MNGWLILSIICKYSSENIFQNKNKQIKDASPSLLYISIISAAPSALQELRNKFVSFQKIHLPPLNHSPALTNILRSLYE